MSIEKGINAKLSDLAKYLDNLTLRTRAKNAKISNDNLLDGKAFNANLPAAHLSQHSIDQGESLINSDVPLFVQANPQIRNKRTISVERNEQVIIRKEEYQTTSAGNLHQYTWRNSATKFPIEKLAYKVESNVQIYILANSAKRHQIEKQIIGQYKIYYS